MLDYRAGLSLINSKEILKKIDFNNRLFDFELILDYFFFSRILARRALHNFASSANALRALAAAALLPFSTIFSTSTTNVL